MRVIRSKECTNIQQRLQQQVEGDRDRQADRQTDKQTDRPTGRRMTKCIYFQFFIYYMYASAEYEHSIRLV